MKTILVATDGSPHADRAIDCAATLARALEALLIVLNVTEAPSAETAAKLKEIEGVAESEIPDMLAHAVLAQARQRARNLGAIKVAAMAESGDATEAILNIAKHRSADLIVVGKRGRGHLAGLLLGSVSQKLVSLATCNVLVVA
jgi:nucleotide-binding universal stress UspA family protein